MRITGISALVVTMVVAVSAQGSGFGPGQTDTHPLTSAPFLALSKSLFAFPRRAHYRRALAHTCRLHFTP